MAKRTPESDLQSKVLDHLLKNKHFVIRLNNVPPVQKIGGRIVFRRMPKGSVLGLPDVLVVWNNKPVWLEIKSPKGVLSKEQKAFRQKCLEHVPEQEYHVIRKLSDVINIGL